MGQHGNLSCNYNPHRLTPGALLLEPESQKAGPIFLAALRGAPPEKTVGPGAVLARCRYRCLHQSDHALEMPRLREEVEGLDIFQTIAGGEETFQIAHLGRGVA